MNFIAFSNIQQSALKKIFQENIDALICPSVQIRKFPDNYQDLGILKDETSFNSYGDISFVFSKNHIFGDHKTIPQNDATHEIYTGDAYTLRFPDIVYTLNKKNMNNFIEEVNELYNEEKLKGYFYNDLPQILQKSHKDKYRIKEEVLNNEAAKLLFIKETGLLESFKVFKTQKYSLNHLIKNDNEFQNILLKMDTMTVRKDPKKYENFIIKKINQLQEEDKEIFQALTHDSNNQPNAIAFYKSFQKDMRLLKNGNEQKIDIKKTDLFLKKMLKKAEKALNTNFNDYIEYYLSEIFINPRIKDNNKPLNAENAVSYMKKMRGSGQEQNQHLSYNRVDGENQRKIRNIEDLELYSNNLVSDEELKIYDKDVERLIQRLSDKINPRDEDFIKIIGRLGRDPKLNEIQLALKGTEFETNNPILIMNIQELAQKNNRRKHLYYEAKPNKAFYFNKWMPSNNKILSHVVVPNDIDSTLLKYLEKTDLKIVKYNAKAENGLSKLKALYQCRDCFINTEEKNQPKNKNRQLM